MHTAIERPHLASYVNWLAADRHDQLIRDEAGGPGDGAGRVTANPTPKAQVRKTVGSHLLHHCERQSFAFNQKENAA